MAGKHPPATKRGARVQRRRAPSPPHSSSAHARPTKNTKISLGAGGTDADTAAAEETRRSGRANKGHHTKRDVLDEPSPAVAAPKPPAKAAAPARSDRKADGPVKGGKKGQAVRAQSTQSTEHEQEDEEQGDDLIRCVCGDQRDIRGRQMICCDTCEAWQHNKCLGLPEGDFWNNKNYYCERCKPEDHVELLAAMARGEKPWARKKGSKAKARPSDVKQETMSETASTPQQATTPSQAAPAPAEAQSPTPTPAPVHSEEATNGQTDAKSESKSQPQSPAGEKRRHEPTAEKANASKKRRKSSHHESKAATQNAPAADIDALPQNQKAIAEKLREILVPLISEASNARGYRIPDGQTARSLATQYTLQISHAAFAAYGEPSGVESPYLAKIRMIMFNVKKNTVLVDRMLSGSLKAQEFVKMEAEEMASEDKQREYAAMREAVEKQAILTEETGPRLRKTHKGEEIVGETDNESHEFKQPELRERESVPEDTAQSPVGNRPPQSPASATRNPTVAETPGEQADAARRPSTNFDINSVFNKVRSPQHDQQSFLRRTSSMQVQDKPPAAVDDADVDRLLKDEDNDVEMSGYSSDPTVCWQGTIHMQSMEPFDAVARFVAGGDFGQVVPWEKLLTNSLSVQGRIESAKGNDYIRGIANTESHEVAILAISPVTSEGRAILDHLFTYFHSRGRWGVVPVDTSSDGILRDLYVIPIEAGGGNLPPFIDMLEHCTIETPRKEPMMILVLIAKLPEMKPQMPPHQHPAAPYPQQDQTPAHAPHPPNTNGPSVSPAPNPHAPQFSPVGPGFPQGSYTNSYVAPTPPTGPPPYAMQPHPQQHQPHQPHQYQQQQPPPPHHQIPRALDILGPYIDAPVIVTILGSNLSQNQAVSELQMTNLRHIVEHIPEARTNLSVLTDHLRMKSEASGVSGAVGGGNGGGGVQQQQ
ncbi:hypothetical protein LEMA_P111400.1 [Plenodomus lingam JN3]|uniref:Transcription factor BYE1 n=1 Tax=Leptosphaeria maculans (strain JN3 / isolate v23.1.3 / race Av1-4-5-6-7-8) TaxID=985895 RepID=E4ZXX6_LEPMJ|nr:hypothetical protein LEMA_P111400.1 [Plenodomus lingam JN3]CBX96221.1 hypothetical protein LEMA_P111400.1 [Plenodomus lingam JN3]